MKRIGSMKEEEVFTRIVFGVTLILTPFMPGGPWIAFVLGILFLIPPGNRIDTEVRRLYVILAYHVCLEGIHNCIYCDTSFLLSLYYRPCIALYTKDKYSYIR